MTTIQLPPDITAVLALSDERDVWMRRVDQAYRDGFNAGRACACLTLAEMEHRREAIAWWREWAAKLQRIVLNDRDPSLRMAAVMREICDDQKFMAEARKKLATKPLALSPLELCALRRIRLEDPGEAV